ncbi:MAG TPA: GNAT family N-acetyltransferase [Micromonosporaceae bacterium]
MAIDLTWRNLSSDDLPAVAALAARCLVVDGGLPAAATEDFLARSFAVPGGVSRGAIDRGGTLVAAGATRPVQRGGSPVAVATGMVDPAHRGLGIGGRLLDWALDSAASLAPAVVVETESLTEEAARLFASRRLRRVFAEDVMRFDLADPIPRTAVPAGIVVERWSAALADRFFAVYEASFRDRPGFPAWSSREWVDWTTGDDDFRPEWSLLAVDPQDGDVGFITCADGWIVQVGVRPDRRGRGLGAALVAEALRRMRAAGAGVALLDVNVDNPAGALYRRLGFIRVGRRARFASIA